jgi:hypothetical protein
VLDAAAGEEADSHVAALVRDGDDPADHITGHEEKHQNTYRGCGQDRPGQCSSDLRRHESGLGRTGNDVTAGQLVGRQEPVADDAG